MKNFSVYSITVDDKSKRYKEFLTNWSDYVNDNEFIRIGIHWGDIAEEIINQNRKNSDFWFNRSRYISPPEIACMLSHKAALENFVSNSIFDWALVLEDDVFPRSYFAIDQLSKIQSIINQGIVHLGGQDGLKPLFSPLLLSKTINGNLLKIILFR